MLSYMDPAEGRTASVTYDLVQPGDASQLSVPDKVVRITLTVVEQPSHRFISLDEMQTMFELLLTEKLESFGVRRATATVAGGINQ